MEQPVRLTFDEALTNYIGEFGRGQQRIVAITALLAIPNGFVFLLWVMITIDPIKNRAWKCINPEDATCSAVWAAPSSQAFCQLPTSSWQWTSHDSLVAQFNLICSDSFKVQLANSFMFIGCFLGSGLFGALSDKIGRKVPLFVATAIAAMATFVSVAAPNYWFMAAMRLVVGMGAAGQVQGIVLICMEATGRSFRGIAGVPQVVLFCVGEFLLVGLAVLVPHWRSLTLAAGSVCAAALLLYPAVPESARWLMSQDGKEEQAAELLRSISIRNGSRMPEQHLLRSHSSMQRSSSSARVQGSGPAVPRCSSMPAMKILSQMRNSSSKGVMTEHHSVGVRLAAVKRDGMNDGRTSSSSDELEGGSSSEWGGAVDVRSGEDDSQDLKSAEAVAAAGQQAGLPAMKDAGVAAPASGSRSATGAAPHAEKGGLLQLLRQPALASMSFAIVLAWFANFFTFYILALGTGGLPGSIYVTFALNVTGQIVATLLSGFLVDRLGRHNIISLSLLLGGGACLACANTASKTAQIVLATLGQFGATASLAATPTYTAELYPTPVRATALGICNKACRLGSISAPLMLMLGASAGVGSAIFLPYSVCGAVSFTAGALVLLTPETLGKDMPEGMEDLQQLQTVFSAKPWRQGGCWATAAFLFRLRAAPKNASLAAGEGEAEVAQQQSACRVAGAGIDDCDAVCMTVQTTVTGINADCSVLARGKQAATAND